MASPCDGQVYVAPPTAGPGAPTTRPAPGLFSLVNWKLTLPTGSKGHPTEILQPALAKFRDARYFYVNGAGNGIFFVCPGNGVTTQNSENPRTELREMRNNGRDEASWRNSSGVHTMIVTQKIHAAPHDVVAGQIHDAADDVTVCRLEGNDLWATKGDTTHGTLLDGAYVLGTQFELKFVASGGQIKTYYNGVLKQTLNKSISGAYFKAGCYNQSHGSSGTAKVEILDLVVTHT